MALSTACQSPRWAEIVQFCPSAPHLSWAADLFPLCLQSRAWVMRPGFIGTDCKGHNQKDHVGLPWALLEHSSRSSEIWSPTVSLDGIEGLPHGHLEFSPRHSVFLPYFVFLSTWQCAKCFPSSAFFRPHTHPVRRGLQVALTGHIRHPHLGLTGTG